MQKTILFIILMSLVNWVQAQEKEKKGNAAGSG